ncbi:MAG: xylan 1,4-beta-xylosidase [Oscillospiraceae bacterium]|nr:xylan 1,4-beta-xylosidase [Oscillospiraceae bacterium]
MAKNKNPRFVEIYSQKMSGRIKVLVDMATGVNYMFCAEDNGFTSASGLTVMLNADGTPVVTPPETFLPPQ